MAWREKAGTQWTCPSEWTWSRRFLDRAGCERSRRPRVGRRMVENSAKGSGDWGGGRVCCVPREREVHTHPRTRVRTELEATQCIERRAEEETSLSCHAHRRPSAIPRKVLPMLTARRFCPNNLWINLPSAPNPNPICYAYRLPRLRSTGESVKESGVQCTYVRLSRS